MKKVKKLKIAFLLNFLLIQRTEMTNKQSNKNNMKNKNY